MNGKVKCNECGKEFTPIGTQNKVGDIYLCNECRFKIPSLFRLTTKKESKNLENVIAKVKEEMVRAKFSQSTINSLNSYIEIKGQKMESFAKEKKDKKEFRLKLQSGELDEQLKKIKITSGYNFEGYEIKDYIQFICEEYVMGTGWLSSKESGIMDTLGGESRMYTKKLKQAKDTVKFRAIQETLQIGGNAIIGATMSYTMFARDMPGVIFSGTAVKIELKN